MDTGPSPDDKRDAKKNAHVIAFVYCRPLSELV